MRTLHVYCDFWEQSVSRALHEVRRHDQFALHVEHIHPGNMVNILTQLASRLHDHDLALVVLMHADKPQLNEVGKSLRILPSSKRARILVSFSPYSPAIGAWAKRIGIACEENEYDASRCAPWEPCDPNQGTTLKERRWIQYTLMRALIAGEAPAAAYAEIFKTLRHARLSEAETALSQRFYERDEPDMAGGNWADVRSVAPNSIDRLRDRAVHVGRSGLNTLIIGETGTGKESLAWYLHEFSLRCHKRFVALNCAFFEGERLESELFGHEQGSFTDAKRMKVGLVEEADGGTLFLDELPEMAPRVQAKLLRFLQDGTYTRLGGTKAMRASVRIISAAQPDRIGTVRQDLYYRVADVELHTVPLRQLKQRDIVNLACNLAYRLMWQPIMRERGQSILTPDVIREIWRKLSLPEHARCLSGYGWPGNMRELSNLIKRLVLLEDDIFEEIRSGPPPVKRLAPDHDHELRRFLTPISSLDELKTLNISLKELQPAYVRHVVASLGGRENIQPTKLAEALGCSYNTLMGYLTD